MHVKEMVFYHGFARFVHAQNEFRKPILDLVSLAWFLIFLMFFVSFLDLNVFVYDIVTF